MKKHTPKIGEALTILERHFYQFRFKLSALLIVFVYLFFQKYNFDSIRRFKLAQKLDEKIFSCQNGF